MIKVANCALQRLQSCSIYNGKTGSSLQITSIPKPSSLAFSGVFSFIPKAPSTMLNLTSEIKFYHHLKVFPLCMLKFQLVP